MMRQNAKYWAPSSCLGFAGLIFLSTLIPNSLCASEAFHLQTFLTQVGAEYIHSPPPGARISALLPLPAANLGHIEDFNSYGPNQVYPERFTLSDGTVLTPFIYVDMSKASPLRKIVSMHAQKISATAAHLDEQLNLLKSYVSDHVFALVPEDDPILLSSSKGLPTYDEVQYVGNLPAGHFPIPVPKKFHTASFESLIEYGRGFCIHKVLLTSLIMKELGIPHSIRFGSTGLSGHNWIQLTDGRILEPTWNLLVRPGKSEVVGGWFKLGDTSVYQFDFYPFAVWDLWQQ